VLLEGVTERRSPAPLAPPRDDDLDREEDLRLLVVLAVVWVGVTEGRPGDLDADRRSCWACIGPDRSVSVRGVDRLDFSSGSSSRSLSSTVRGVLPEDDSVEVPTPPTMPSLREETLSAGGLTGAELKEGKET